MSERDVLARRALEDALQTDQRFTSTEEYVEAVIWPALHASGYAIVPAKQAELGARLLDENDPLLAQVVEGDLWDAGVYFHSTERIRWRLRQALAAALVEKENPDER